VETAAITLEAIRLRVKVQALIRMLDFIVVFSV
jgi:hypothetical protein